MAEGGVLTSDAARRIFASTAAAGLSAALFQRFSIPIADHTAMLDPPTPGMAGSKIRVCWSEGSRTFRDLRTRHVRLADPEGTFVVEAVAPGSVLDTLIGVAEHVGALFSCDQSQAAWWVLTGELPAISALTARVGWDYAGSEGFRLRRTKIRIEADAWVPTEMILAVYQAAQREASPGQRRNRPIPERGCRLFRFVVERRHDRGPPLSWENVVKEWNGVYPNWACRTRSGDPNARACYQAFWRVTRTIAD